MKNTIIIGLLILATACGGNEQTQDPLLVAYYNLKDALVETNSNGASAAALKVIAASQNIAGMEDVIRNAEIIIEDEGNIEGQRIAFEHLSMSLYDIISASNPHGETVYVQFCPMAFDNKGAFWLSDNEEIFNPYFGDKMLKCGVVKETISL
jgi:hypothetical protein